ncbi:DUF2501 domain-containing protein [Klebsiella sp. BIGb0407]|uniref:DUF2501 domain-containing protein n=1 Tax=Klebsiella sp. BIGb0407 TaxID=2940603 RepID=UPI002167F655|nr:DUF2501 domain-containing protein [Klebsiella sp. BIGb0407]MCS3433763.1 hypothetical protein [Klebsiella sp. BIGb0407]
MKKMTKSLCSVGWAICLLSTTAHAASWQDSLNGAASDLLGSSSGSKTTASTTDGGLSLGTITKLLGGGNNAVASSSMTNATGVLEYCIRNKVVNNVNGLTDQLQSKLGLNSNKKQSKETSYQQGIAGLLNTGSNQKLDLNALGETELGKQLKTKACNVVLDQGKSYLGL